MVWRHRLQPWQLPKTKNQEDRGQGHVAPTHVLCVNWSTCCQRALKSHWRELLAVCGVAPSCWNHIWAFWRKLNFWPSAVLNCVITPDCHCQLVDQLMYNTWVGTTQPRPRFSWFPVLGSCQGWSLCPQTNSLSRDKLPSCLPPTALQFVLLSSHISSWINGDQNPGIFSETTSSCHLLLHTNLAV